MKQIRSKPSSISSKPQQKHGVYRRGTIILIPLVCLVLSLAVIGELLKQSSLELKQLKKEQYHLQAIWLADAAAQRAIDKLSTQQDYQGETWALLPEEIGGAFPGEVIINVDRRNRNDEFITIRAQASYPATAAERVRIIREWSFEISNTSSKK